MKRTPVLPRCWLFTDERLGGADLGDPLWLALARLPGGSGIVFRHYGLAAGDRAALLDRVAMLARRRRLLLVVAYPPTGWRGRLRHWPAHAMRRSDRAAGLQTAACHDARDVERAVRAGADLVFLSPVFPTRSHPGAAVLGPVRFGLILSGRSRRAAAVPVVALGGMSAARWPPLQRMGGFGWAAIDAWAEPVRRHPHPPGRASETELHADGRPMGDGIE